MSDEISLPAHLLEAILDTSLTALYFSQTFDLADAYRQMEPEPKGSPLTQDLAKTIALLEGYINIKGDDAVGDDPAQEKDEEDVSTPEQ